MPLKKGRGAQINTDNRFEDLHYSTRNDYLEFLHKNGEDTSLNKKTKIVEVFPKTIVNKVSSPDVPMSYSLNPYQGCEHGCTYCYARNSHEYWGYSAGTDFEQVILVKKNASTLLEQSFQKKNWECKPIILSGNTDCYQPIEKQLGITRQLLEVFLKYQNPVGIISKNALMFRDLDLLKKLHEKNLVQVNISITTLNEKLRSILEPRTASIKKRLELVRILSEIGIPVNILMAPIIPGLNSHEIMDIAKESSKVGALSIGYTMVRLNGQIATIFSDWLEHHFPDRAQKIKHQIQDCHGGSLNDSIYGQRMSGQGHYAAQIKQTMALAKRRYFAHREIPKLNIHDFIRIPKGQYRLF